MSLALCKFSVFTVDELAPNFFPTTNSYLVLLDYCAPDLHPVLSV
jgi:hypothetical protein